jgi:hypothetical protein
MYEISTSSAQRESLGLISHPKLKHCSSKQGLDIPGCHSKRDLWSIPHVTSIQHTDDPVLVGLYHPFRLSSYGRGVRSIAMAISYSLVVMIHLVDLEDFCAFALINSDAVCFVYISIYCYIE